MALADEVTSRLSAVRLIQLTNPDKAEAGAADAGRLTLACTDAESEFKVHVGQAFLLTDPDHVAAAVDLAVLLLQERGSGPTDTLGRDRERIIGRLKDLAKIKGRNRLLPGTAKDTAETFTEDLFEHTTLDPQPTREDDED